MNPPKPPLSRVIREGTHGTCPKCHSTEQKKFGILGGKILGCINPDCDNYYKKVDELLLERKLKINKIKSRNENTKSNLFRKWIFQCIIQ